jgi:hypothetical protein
MNNNLRLKNKLNRIGNYLIKPVIQLSKSINLWLNNLRSNAIHLFLLSPPLCGSTVVQQLIGTSPKVSVLDVEGQWLPEAIPILGAPTDSWDPNHSVDWERVKRVFGYYWSPFKPVRFEKSPPHILRAKEIEAEFQNCYMLILIRNPYARIEGAIRRKWHPSVQSAAQAWVKEAKTQIQNIETLQNCLFFRYEDMVKDPDAIVNKILDFLPELKTLNPNATFTAHNINDKPINGFIDLNGKKIQNLTQSQLDEINLVLEPNEEILEYYKYKLIRSPSEI